MPSFEPQSKFYLLKDVDIDVSYTNQYYFTVPSEQRNFFNSKIFKTVSDGTYQRKNSNILEVPFNADEIRECKYIMWQNTNYSDKWYYAFVTFIDYINPNVARIGYELDVYQTYLFDVEWKQSFIDRQHTQRYNNGLPVINLEDEGLEYGDNYQITRKVFLYQIQHVAFAIMGFTEQLETSFVAGGNTIHGVPTQLYYYIIPIYLDYPGRNFTLNNNSVSNITDFLNACVTNTELVGKMVSCTIVPFLTIGAMTSTDSGTTINITSNNLSVVTLPSSKGSFALLRPTYSAELQPYEITDGHTIYQDFPAYDESKLLMYPYSFTELTTERGDAFIIKNEYLALQNGSITIGIFGNINFQNKMAFLVKNYLTDTTSPYAREYYMEHGIHDSSNANLPIIDDYTASYLQANSNSIEVARSNALMQQQSAMQVAQNTRTMEGNNANRNRISNYMGALNNAMQGMSSALSSNTPLGAIGGVVSGISGAVTGLVQAQNSYANAIASANTSLANSRISAQTDYQMSVATVNAKIRDAEQIPSNTRSMGGDYMFDIAYQCNGIYLLKKTIMPYYAEKLTQYFKMYGYKVNKLEIPLFHTRESWNYIKMVEPNVEGNIPMNDLLKIRDIFIKGITLWHGDYIGNYLRTNNEL